MALQINYVQPATGVPSPKAYLKVVDATVMLAENRTTILPAIFHTKATADAGKDPVATAAVAGQESAVKLPPIVLTSVELDAPNPAFVQALAGLVAAGKITSPGDALRACLYVLIKQMPEYSGAADV